MKYIRSRMVSLTVLAAIIVSLFSPVKASAVKEIDGSGKGETLHSGDFGWRAFGFKAGGTIMF